MSDWNDYPRKRIVALEAENDALQHQRDELLAAINRLIFESEEYDFPDGMGRGSVQMYWDDLEAVISSVKGDEPNAKKAQKPTPPPSRVIREGEYQPPAQSESERDAARYRWLRENWTTMVSEVSGNKLVLTPNQPRWGAFGEDVIDAAIDAAMQEGKK